MKQRGADQGQPGLYRKLLASQGYKMRLYLRRKVGECVVYICNERLKIALVSWEKPHLRQQQREDGWLAKFLKQSEYFWADLNPLYIQKETSLHHLWSEVICDYSFISSFKPAPNSS